MKFRFCGDLDCPDWVLAEILSLSKISSLRVKVIGAYTIRSILYKDILKNDMVEKFEKESKINSKELMAVISLLKYILTCSTIYSVNSETLSFELQQLGLPKEHSTVLCKLHEDSNNNIEAYLKNSSLKLNTLENISWKICFLIDSKHVEKLKETVVSLKLCVRRNNSDKLKTHGVLINLTQLKVLLNELREAKKLMNETNEQV